MKGMFHSKSKPECNLYPRKYKTDSCNYDLYVVFQATLVYFFHIHKLYTIQCWFL